MLSILRNEADAEDAAQETAIKVYRNLHLFRGESQFRTWVLSIARNEGLGRLRKTETRREDSLDALTEDQSGDFTPAILTSWREVPTEALERQELGACCDRRLTACRRFTVTSCCSETSKRWTCVKLPPRWASPRAAVKVRLHRARALLQRSLAPRIEGVCSPSEAKLFRWLEMRIDCKHVWEHISAYIDGEVDAALRAEIDRHLETCEICSAVLDSTRNVVVLIADDRVFELPAGIQRAAAPAPGKGNGIVRSLSSAQVAIRGTLERRGAVIHKWMGIDFQPDQHERGNGHGHLQPF